MLENRCLSTVKLKKYIKTRSLLPTLTFWSIKNLRIQEHKKELEFSKKKFHSFIDLGLHFDLCENESYSTFVAKAGFFTHKNLSNKIQNFYKLKICDNVPFNIYSLQQKSASQLLQIKLLSFLAQLSLFSKSIRDRDRLQVNY